MTTKRSSPQWLRVDHGSKYVFESYELVLLTARGGWRSWNVMFDETYLANVPTLALAKRRAETHLRERIFGGAS